VRQPAVILADTTHVPADDQAIGSHKWAATVSREHAAIILEPATISPRVTAAVGALGGRGRR
jgi:hypothetical protein